MGKITRESWMFIAEEIIAIVEECSDISYYNGNNEFVAKKLEQLLVGEGIIEVIED